MVTETRKSNRLRSSLETSPQRNPTKVAKHKKTVGQPKRNKRQKVSPSVPPEQGQLNNHTGSEPGDEGLVINNHTPAGEVVAEPKFPWAKLLSQYPQRPHCVITSDVFTVGNLGSDLVIRDGDLLCELTQMKNGDGGPSVATLKIKGSGIGPVVVNRMPYLKGTCVDLQGGDEVIFSTPWKHAYIFQPLKYENLSAAEYRDSTATISEAQSQAHKEFLQESVLNPHDIEFSLENFPYPLSDTTKDDLIKSTILRLNSGGKFAKYVPKQSTTSPRILLSGQAGSEIYRELLAKALAKHYGAKLMIVDTLFLPGESTSKEADSTKESDSRGNLSVLAEQAAPTSTFKTGDRVKVVLSASDRAFASYHLAELRGPKKGFKGKVILAFEDNESSKLGVIFDMPIADGNDLGGLCEIDYGFFCAASSLRLDSSSDEDADKPAINEIFEVVSNESEKSSLILMLKDIGKSVSRNNELYFTLKSKLETLPENTVVIASQTQLDSPEENRQRGVPSLSLCHHPMPCYSEMLELQYPELIQGSSPKPVKRITTLFPNLVTIGLPEDADSLMGCKKKVERVTETSKAEAIITSIRAALSKSCLECPDLETLRINDQSLSTESANEVVEWALRHQVMSSSVAMNDDRIIISVESIIHGLEMIHNKNRSTK